MKVKELISELQEKFVGDEELSFEVHKYRNYEIRRVYGIHDCYVNDILYKRNKVNSKQPRPTIIINIDL